MNRTLRGVIIVLCGMVLAACQPVQQKENQNHIHSLAVDPTEEGVLYLGTHYFLEKYDGLERERIGRYGDDFMGFVIAGDGSFYSSGHSPTVGNVGIRKSNDKGKTWTTLAYEGLDFHDMAVSYANPNVIYAWSTPPQVFLTISLDAGETWEVLGNTIGKDLYALAADHQNANVLYAGTLFGLFVSEDQGRTWKDVPTLTNNSVIAIADDPGTNGVMYVSTANQGVLKTIDNGTTWDTMNTGLPTGKPGTLAILTVNPSKPSELYGATSHGEVYRFEGSAWEKTEIEVN